MWLIIFIAELISLFILSRYVSVSLSRLFFRLTKNQSASNTILFFVFLPGIVIHEVSHMISAAVLFVPVGKIDFFPKAEGNSVRMGSVMIGQTDPIKRAIIGFAPVLVGLFLMILVLPFFKDTDFVSGFWKYLLAFLIIFEIGNTMFSSSKDMEGSAFFLIILIGSIIALILLKVPVIALFQSFISSPATVAFFKNADLFLLLPIAIDAGIVLTGRFLTKRY